MAPELALSSLAELPKGKLVLDPMAGSGTVLNQAVRLGHRAIGFDMDPLAVLMSRVWTSKVEREIFEAELDRVLEMSLKVDLRRQRLPWHDAETKAFIQYWFAAEQRLALTRLAIAIYERSHAASKSVMLAVDALRIALSRIVITKEQCASLARDTSHSRPHRVSLESTYDVMAGFVRSARQVLQRVSEQPMRARSSVSLGDARRTRLRNGSVDLLMTSPPYLNAIDYMRGHRMSLVWLGYSLQSLREIRAETVGAERRKDCVDAAALDVAAAMCDIKSLPSRRQAMVFRYAQDLLLMLREAKRVLKVSGTATYVVGNSCLKGVFINNAKGVARAGELAGMGVDEWRERDLPASNRYLPVTEGGALSKRMRTEVVIRFAN
jgi:hypothetical protein